MVDLDQLKNLPCWQGAIDLQPLSGGMTNHNFVVNDSGRRYVVRVGEDIPEHLLWRQNEGEVSRVAAENGFSPAVLYRESGILVIDFIDGKTYEAEDVRSLENLPRLVELLKRFHTVMPQKFDTYPMLFWVFQVIRHYGVKLEGLSERWSPRVPELLRTAEELERVVGPVDLVFGHNDLLPANFIDDGERLWLIDFDYAGFNSPLFDLANLASNCELDESGERQLLDQYFGEPASDQLMHRYEAMKCASLMREMMWSMVSEMHSKIDFDYTIYTAENTERYDRAWSAYSATYGAA